MADLSTLDATQPVGSDPVSQGDDAIRATRDAVKTSFGGTDTGSGAASSEHYLLGPHKFPNGTTAARPAAGNAGRIYLNTERTWIDRDDGSAWRMANAVAPATGTGSAITLTTSHQVLATASVTVPTGGRVVLTAHARFISALTGTVTMRLRSQATFTLVTVGHTLTGAVSATVPIVYLDQAPTPGAVSYTLEALDSGVSITLSQATLVAIVC